MLYYTILYYSAVLYYIIIVTLYYRYKSHIHLVGCTNSGKSSLFNNLLMSDLCKVSARDKVARATTSLWPGRDLSPLVLLLHFHLLPYTITIWIPHFTGTTLNLLKFPLAQPSRYMLALRAMRLREYKVIEDSDKDDKERKISSLTLKGETYLFVTMIALLSSSCQ